MRVRRASHTIATWLCLLAYMVSCIVPTRGFVLCFGPDGHVAVEAQAEAQPCSGCLDEHCQPDSKESREVSHDRLTSPGGCVCTDISLHRSEMRKDRDQLRLPSVGGPVALMPVMQQFPGIEPSAELRRDQVYRGAGGASQLLVHLRTVILVV